MEPKVSIIILNWNGWRDTIECLESLYNINYSNYDIILIDNFSEDNSLEKIKKYCNGTEIPKSNFFEYNINNKPIHTYFYLKEQTEDLNFNIENKNLPANEQLTIIKNNQNYGFAEGNNIGIKYVLKNLDPDYILLLNNDTVVDNNFLTELVTNANQQNVGFLGPKVYYYDYNGRKDVINFAGGKLNTIKGSTRHLGFNEIDKGQHEKINEIDYVQGCCILIKKKIFKEVGFLDINYFTYWEETDLCRRGFNKGYKSIYVPKAKIWHKVGSSNIGKTKFCYMVRNRFMFMKKNFGTNEYLLFLIYFSLIDMWFNILVIIFFKKDFDMLKAFFKGLRRSYV